MSLPWFMYSPSPVSLMQYGILTFILWGYMLKAATYRKHARLMAAIDAFFTVAFFVVFTDSFWCLFCILKWLPLYPGDALQIYSSLGRDLLASGLFGLFIWDHIKAGVLNLNKNVYFWLIVSFVAQAFWFYLAPSITFTDYTQAWLQGYDSSAVFLVFLISHFLMRIPLWMALLNIRSDLLK